ncbi:MAG: hypothetical protein ACRDX8_02985 [Acidimicrobiales bacterium]
MDAAELIAALESDPHSRELARRLILTDELLSLPDLVRENSRQIAENTRAISELRESIAELREVVRSLEAQMQLLGHRVENLTGDMGGMRLELAYRNHTYGYFGRLLKRSHALTDRELSDLLSDAVEDGRLSAEGAEDVALADLIVTGTADGQLTYLVVEISRSLRTGDVVRAERRAGALSGLGDPVKAVVAGDSVHGSVVEAAEEAGVGVVLDGRKIV